MASKKVAEAYVALQLQTAQFKAAIGEATNETKKFSAQMREEMAKSRESVKLLNEELHVGIPRGLQRIISTLPGVTTAMNAAFDAVVVFALIKTVVEATEKVVEFAHKAEEAAKKHAEAWGNAIGSITDTNDKLELTKTKLENAIAKLEHKPQNKLKEAIEEAKVAAEELGKQLDADAKTIATTLKGEEATWFGKTFLHQTGVDTASGIAQDAQFKLNQITAGTYKGSGDPTADRNAVIRDALSLARARLAPAQRELDRITAAFGGKAPDTSSSAKEVQSLTELIAYYTQMQTKSGLTQQVAADQGKLGVLQGNQAYAGEVKKAAEEFVQGLKKQFEESDRAPALTGDFIADKRAREVWENGKAGREQKYVANNAADALSSGTLTREEWALVVHTYFPLLVKNTQDAANKQGLTNEGLAFALQNSVTADNQKLDEESRKLQTEQIEALKKLTEATDRSRDSLVRSINEFNDVQDKVRLQRGQITESEYQALHVGRASNGDVTSATGLHATLESAKKESADKASSTIKVLYSEAYAKLLAMLSSTAAIMAKEGLVDGLYLVQPEDGGEPSLTFEANPSNTPEQRKRLNALDLYDTNYRSDVMAGVEASAGRVNKVKENESATATQNFDTADYLARLAAYQSTAVGGIDAVFDEIIARSNDAGKTIHDVLSGAISSINDAIMKDLTDKDPRGAWKDAGKGIFTNVAKAGLEKSEGSLMKALGLGSGKNPTGTAGDPIHTKSVDNPISGVGGLNGANGLLGGLFGKLNDNNWASSLFGGKLFGSGSIFGNLLSAVIPRAGGGLMSPGDFYLTGEHGPELLQVGSTSKINNARETAGILSGAGTTHNWDFSVDARGASDPVAINLAVQRGIVAAAPYIVAASNAAQKDQQRRVPNSRT